ncbi:MAG: hypothetical protein ACUVV6_08120 [Thermoplasmatota archaeon]
MVFQLRVRASRAGRAGCRRPSRLRRALAAALALVLLSQLTPLLAADPSEPPMPSTTYGIFDDLAALQAERLSRYSSPAILREARDAVDSIQPRVAAGPSPPPDPGVTEPAMPSFASPAIFSDAETNVDLNGTSILEWLLQGPLNYWVSTSYEGLRTWSRGSLRPTLDLTVDETGVHIVDWERWVEVDVDQNGSTGDPSGSELRARISLVVENYSFERPHLVSVVPPELSDWQFNFSGGVSAEIERLANATAKLPLEVSFLKAFMYEGLNYIWIIGVNFSDLPSVFRASVVANKVNTHGSLREIVGDLLQNFSLGNASLLGDISGPYEVGISTEPLDGLSLLLGYAKAVSRSLVERSWIRIGLGVADGLASLPGEMSLWLDSPSFNMSFNHLRWTAGAPCVIDAEVSVERGNLTYATLSIDEAPEHLALRLDNNSAGGAPDNYARFETSAPVERIEYNEWEFYTTDRREFKHMHTLLKGVPTLLELRGTFEVGGPAPPLIGGEPGIGLVARLLDSIMVRFAGKFATIARTLRSIPENVLRMPERDGWLTFSIPPGQSLGELELWIASGPYILRPGSFMAFHNLSLPPSPSPLMSVSFSARLLGLTGLDTDFRNGTYIDLRSSSKQLLTAVFVDESRMSNATVEVDPLPTRLVLEQSRANRTLTISTSETVARIAYMGWVRDQHLGVSIEGLPASLSLVQTPEEMVIETPPGRPVERLGVVATDARIQYLEGNHLLVSSGPGGTSFSASFSGLSRLAVATGPEGRLELGLSSAEPLKALIANETEGLRARLLIDPLPSNISLGLGSLIGGGLRIPDLMSATSVVGFSTAVFAITELGEDIMRMAEQLAGFIDEQVSGLGRNSTIRITSEADATLVVDIQKGSLVEAPWVHGIASRQLTQPNRTLYSTKVYLRLGRETYLRTSGDGDRLSFSISLRGSHPLHDWLLVDMEGVAGRDLLAYLTALPPALDLTLSGRISQNTTYGRETLDAEMVLGASSALGPFLVSLARPPPVGTRFLSFGSSLPSEATLKGRMGDSVRLDYSASAEVEYLLLKSSRLVRERWRSSTVLLHQLPLSLNASLEPPAGFEARDPPTQVLPELVLVSDRPTLDLFVDLDGRAAGQRTSYQVEVRNAGRSLTARHSGGCYRVRGTGVEELYIIARDLPYRQSLRIETMGLYVEGLSSLDLSSSLVLGSYPTFSLLDLSAESIHLSISTLINIGGAVREGRLVLLDSRSRGWAPLGVQLYESGVAAGPSRGEDHMLIPLPLASLFGSLLWG